MKVVIGIVIAVIFAAMLKQCSDCYNEGGTPVRAVVGYACLKK
jgi:hypothetical protein